MSHPTRSKEEGESSALRVTLPGASRLACVQADSECVVEINTNTSRQRLLPRGCPCSFARPCPACSIVPTLPQVTPCALPPWRMSPRRMLCVTPSFAPCVLHLQAVLPICLSVLHPHAYAPRHVLFLQVAALGVLPGCRNHASPGHIPPALLHWGKHTTCIAILYTHTHKGHSTWADPVPEAPALRTVCGTCLADSVGCDFPWPVLSPRCDVTSIGMLGTPLGLQVKTHPTSASSHNKRGKEPGRFVPLRRKSLPLCRHP